MVLYIERLFLNKERLVSVIGALKKKREQSKMNYKFWDVISIILREINLYLQVSSHQRNQIFEPISFRIFLC